MFSRLMYFLSHVFLFIYGIGGVAAIIFLLWSGATKRYDLSIVSIIFIFLPLLFNSVYWIVTGENFFKKHFVHIVETKKGV